MNVAGVDGTRTGWVAVSLTDGKFADARLFPSFEEVLETLSGVDMIAADIPIGLPITGQRRADQEARRILGPRRNSVFFVPPARVLEAQTFKDAVIVARGLGSFVSQQIYGLRHKILEVDGTIASHAEVREVHPEVSFWALNRCVPLAHRKVSWNGLMRRLELLSTAGIELPPFLDGIGDVQVDDIVDAAAAAWSAQRIARGNANSLPHPPEVDQGGRQVAIWY